MIMSNMYQRRIEVIMETKYQEVFDEFLNTFIPTTKIFSNLRLNIVHPPNHKLPQDSFSYEFPLGVFGARVVGPIFKEALERHAEIIVLCNDDLWFSEGWLEDMIRKIDEGHLLVCAGIADTNDKESFKKFIEETKDDVGHENFIYLSCAAYTPHLFKRIGLFDPNYGGSCEDVDLIWRVLLNRIPFCMLRRIRVAHYLHGTANGSSHKDKSTRDSARHLWLEKYNKERQYFYEKHGYTAFRETAKFMKNNNVYYRKFK